MENDLFLFVEKILGERFANEDIELQIIAFFRSFIFSTTFSKQNFIESEERREAKTNGDRSQTRPRY